jgi:Flp pilus assembly protein TadD
MNRILHLGLLALIPTVIACAGARTSPAAAPSRVPSAAELFARGMHLAARGDALRGEQYLLMAMRAGYPPERVIVPLVRVCIASARLRAALAHAQPYLQRRPGTWQLRYLTAAIHLALGQPIEALTELRRLLAQRPSAGHAHYLMGIALRDGLGDAAAAHASFEAYLRNEPRGQRAPEVLAWLAEHPKPPADEQTADPAPHAEATR